MNVIAIEQRLMQVTSPNNAPRLGGTTNSTSDLLSRERGGWLDDDDEE